MSLYRGHESPRNDNRNQHAHAPCIPPLDDGRSPITLGHARNCPAVSRQPFPAQGAAYPCVRSPYACPCRSRCGTDTARHFSRMRQRSAKSRAGGQCPPYGAHRPSCVDPVLRSAASPILRRSWPLQGGHCPSSPPRCPAMPAVRTGCQLALGAA
jgi:hypothetical protein